MPKRRRKKRANSYKGAVAKAAEQVLRGQLLAIDPASGRSSNTGYALFASGELVEYGIVELTRGSIQAMLRELYETFEEDQVDVLAIERVRGRLAHEYLRWSVGCLVASINPPTLIEVPVTAWQSYAKATGEWEKGDDTDALYIGLSVLEEAKCQLS